MPIVNSSIVPTSWNANWIMSDRYLSFPFVICPLIRTFDFVEGRLHLGKAKKNKFSFGFSLDLHL